MAEERDFFEWKGFLFGHQVHHWNNDDEKLSYFCGPFNSTKSMILDPESYYLCVTYHSFSLPPLLCWKKKKKKNNQKSSNPSSMTSPPKHGPNTMKILFKLVEQSILSVSQSMNVNEVFNTTSYLLTHSLIWSTSTAWELCLKMLQRTFCIQSISLYSHFLHHSSREEVKRSQHSPISLS